MSDSPKFVAFVKYEQPSYNELRRRFRNKVHPDYKGINFAPIERRKGTSHKNRDVTFVYVHLGRIASTDEALAEMDRMGLLPALDKELLSFDEKYPDEKLEHPIIALGSMSGEGNNRRVASLVCAHDNSEEPWLELGWFRGHDHLGYWSDDARFLAVRKDS